MRILALGVLAALLTSCGDEGHVGGEMAAGGTGASAGTSNTDRTGGQMGSTSSASSTSASGGTGSNGSSSSSSASSSGGASAATSTGGVSGSGGSSSTGAGGGGGSCEAGYTWCPGCHDGEGSCQQGGCPASACPGCAEEQTEQDCDARVDCHSVYADLNSCGCPTLGCCMGFVRCAQGSSAECAAQEVGCDSLAPPCEPGGYATAYAGDCYEGCVKPEDCSGSNGSGGSGGGTGNCDCVTGAYLPMCGVDGVTYDANCGEECVPVDIACTGECPCPEPNCDVGCTPMQGSWCGAPEVEWVCEGTHDAIVAENCGEPLPTGAIRYCCPASFLAECVASM